MTVKELEEHLIVQTLNHVNHNRTHAAEMLGISMQTLRNKLREYRQENSWPQLGNPYRLRRTFDAP